MRGNPLEAWTCEASRETSLYQPLRVGPSLPRPTAQPSPARRKRPVRLLRTRTNFAPAVARLVRKCASFFSGGEDQPADRTRLELTSKGPAPGALQAPIMPDKGKGKAPAVAGPSSNWMQLQKVSQETALRTCATPVLRCWWETILPPSRLRVDD